VTLQAFGMVDVIMKDLTPMLCDALCFVIPIFASAGDVQ
jgi:hypothetical protein